MPTANVKNKAAEKSIDKNKVLVIVGPTGSGKTGLAIKCALALNGEIISADSRAIYRDMNTGTAKPDMKEMQGVPHWGLDLVNPGERFTVADFKSYCLSKIKEIQARGKLAIIAGGTGLYVDAVIYDYKFNDVVEKTYSDRTAIGSEFIVIGLKWEREELRKRLEKRANKMFAQKIFRETKFLIEKYGWKNQAMKANIYQFVHRVEQGELTKEEARHLFVIDDWQLSRRQITWFKRNNKIVWLRLDEAENYIYNMFR